MLGFSLGLVAEILLVIEMFRSGRPVTALVVGGVLVAGAVVTAFIVIGARTRAKVRPR